MGVSMAHLTEEEDRGSEGPSNLLFSAGERLRPATQTQENMAPRLSGRGLWPGLDLCIFIDEVGGHRGLCGEAAETSGSLCLLLIVPGLLPYESHPSPCHCAAAEPSTPSMPLHLEHLGSKS